MHCTVPGTRSKFPGCWFLYKDSPVTRDRIPDDPNLSAWGGDFWMCMFSPKMQQYVGFRHSGTQALNQYH